MPIGVENWASVIDLGSVTLTTKVSDKLAKIVPAMLRGVIISMFRRANVKLLIPKRIVRRYHGKQDYS
jgi:hypothetical protein